MHRRSAARRIHNEVRDRPYKYFSGHIRIVHGRMFPKRLNTGVLRRDPVFVASTPGDPVMKSLLGITQVLFLLDKNLRLYVGKRISATHSIKCPTRRNDFSAAGFGGLDFESPVVRRSLWRFSSATIYQPSIHAIEEGQSELSC